MIPPCGGRKDIYVWAIMYHHIQQPSQAKRLHRMLHTLQKAKKSASGTMRDAAQGGRNASSHTSAGTQAARVSTLAKCVPNVLELQRALTPLRHSQFEGELVNHPDKACTDWLLSSIKNGVALGYDGPRGLSEAHNLKLALEHTGD